MREIFFFDCYTESSAKTLKCRHIRQHNASKGEKYYFEFELFIIEVSFTLMIGVILTFLFFIQIGK